MHGLFSFGRVEIGHVPLAMRQPFLGFPSYYIFSLEEIEDATNNFDPSNLIADRSQGQVKEFSYLFIGFRMILYTRPSGNFLCTLAFSQLYNGWLTDRSMVMVNRVKLKQKCLNKNSIECLKVLPYLRHKNLVSILGHCVTTQQDRLQMISSIFIVFEHVSNVSLRDYLAGEQKTRTE